MKPNVLLVILDSVRAKNTSLHGYERETTPFLASLGEEATVYEQARTPGVASNPSHASIFTGLHVEEHCLTDRTKSLEPGHSVYEALREEGYETGVFSQNTFLTQAAMGFEAGFGTIESGLEYRLPFPEALDPMELSGDGNKYTNFAKSVVEHRSPFRSLYNGVFEMLPSTIPERLPSGLRGGRISGDVYIDLLLEWLSERDGPWAACVNLMDAHTPYLPAPEHRRWDLPAGARDPGEYETSPWYYFGNPSERGELDVLETLYDGCIREADTAVERLVTELRTRGVYDDTLVVITADHGEGFGERCEGREVPTIGHGVSGGIAEEVLHVPLLVKYPEQTASEVVEQPASPVEFPTVVDNVLGDSWERDDFVPEGPVRSAMLGMNTAVADAASEYLDDLSPFRSAARVRYDWEDGTVIKSVVTDDVAVSLSCPNAQTKTEPEPIDREVFEESFPPLQSMDVLASESDDVTEEIRSQLEYLGYA